jgi:hypothetical protein
MGNDAQSYIRDVEEDKRAKEATEESWINRFKKSKFVGFFWFLYVIFLPVILLFRVAGMISYAMTPRHRRHRSWRRK